MIEDETDVTGNQIVKNNIQKSLNAVQDLLASSL
jgi:hypothetical protein